MDKEYDAIIVGAGHNGLVAGIYLARAGWRVLILEREPEPGGAVKTAEVTLPGFRHDLYATNLNLFAGSPFYREFKSEIDAQGLEFVPAAHTFSSVFPDGSYIGVSSDLEQSLANIRRVAPQDSETWRQMVLAFPAAAERLLPLLGEAMPSLGLARAIWRGWRAQGTEWLFDTAQLLISSPREFAEAHFGDARMHSLVAAWAMHLNFTPDMAGGALFSYLESMANQSFGMVLGKGGADVLIKALKGLFLQLGGSLRTDSEVTEISIEAGRATGVVLADGGTVSATRAVIANLTPRRLFGALVPARHLPARFLRAAGRFRYGPGTMMVHLALDDLPDWRAGPELKRYVYVHVAPYMEDMTAAYSDGVAGLLPASPMLVVAQPTAVDPSRAPEGKHVMWIQVRVAPATIRGDAAGRIEAKDWRQAKEAYADRVIDKLAEYAPDIHDKIIGRCVLSPADLEAANANLVDGDQLSGSHCLSQNFLFRPLPGWSRYKTPVDRLYMVGASTWPGAGLGAGSGRLLGKMLS